jgi:signal transduction histidine kinase/CheY-like chemotaxis protein
VSRWSILSVAIEREGDVVAVRQRARRISQLLGFDIHSQTRIATAVSEIARNAVSYAGGGRGEFSLSGADVPQRLIIRIRDKGPGITGLQTILAGRYKSRTGLGLGIAGARRLMDDCHIETGEEKGTTVTLHKCLPRGAELLAPPALVQISQQIAAEEAGDPLVEIRAQNQELMRSLEELGERQEESFRLNEELKSTNKAVVALYAELNSKSVELKELNRTLEDRVVCAIAERELAEESLRQSQKMEAVGQLTGGIAHDFNNLLQVITGNIDILGRNLPEDAERLRRAADNAMRGAERAAILTQRLLAFSRRQPLAPRPIEVNALVGGMLEIIRRALGEPVEMETVLAGNLWRVEADPNQLENALLNLAVNARDAMQSGGKLTIETMNTNLDEVYSRENPEVVPGPYVAVCVTDTGSGMSKKTMARVFEPFFTTKDVGRGTGLGLSMVYGFVKQSGGHIRLFSEEGHGTTVKIYLPRLFGIAVEDEIASELSVPQSGKDEVILVVEDDEDVRVYSVDVLRELGYRVLEAEDGPSALRVLEEQDRVDLIFSDIMLTGGINGAQLVREARSRCPHLKALFTSGYARDAILDSGGLDADVQMIGKPFTFVGLASRVRDVLDSTAA